MIVRTPPRNPIPSRSEAHQGIISADSNTEEFKQIQLVLDGYTVTTKAAALGRVGDRYVMRNLLGHRIELPLLIDVASFVQTWTTFRRLSGTGQTVTDGVVIDHVVPAAVDENITALLLARQSILDLSVVDGRRAIGDLITIHGRILNEHGKPLSNTNIEMWQANAAGRYQHTGHEYDAPLDPNFCGNGVVCADPDGRFRITTIGPGHYRVPGVDGIRPHHFHFILSGSGFTNRAFTEMYFPGDPLMTIGSKKSMAMVVPKQQICRFDPALTAVESVLSYRYDIVLGGSDATPLAEVSKHDWIT